MSLTQQNLEDLDLKGVRTLRLRLSQRRQRRQRRAPLSPISPAMMNATVGLHFADRERLN